jgi:PDZ domain-containing secreted protein
MNLENKDVDGILKYADPVIAAILNKAISGKDITSREALVLFDAKGIDFQLVGRVADYLRKEKVGDTVTYVVNRKGKTKERKGKTRWKRRRKHKCRMHKKN